MVKIENRRITSLFDGGCASAFSMTGINKGSKKHEWNIKITRFVDEVYIVITDNPNMDKANTTFWGLSGGYAFFSGGYICSQ